MNLQWIQNEMVSRATFPGQKPTEIQMGYHAYAEIVRMAEAEQNRTVMASDEDVVRAFPELTFAGVRMVPLLQLAPNAVDFVYRMEAP